MATIKTISFDWAMKYLLRDKSNFGILEGFLSTLLNKDIKIIDILESESNNLEGLKFNRVDLMVSSKEEQFIIEIQNSRETDYLERILFGASKVIADSLKLGEEYRNIKKVISVNILYFNLGDGIDYIYHGKTDFYGLNKKDKLILRKRIFISEDKFKLEAKNIFPEYYLIRVGKFEEIIGDPIDEWIYMFKNNEIKDDFKSKGMKEVRKKLNYINMSEKERKLHDRYLMDLARERDIVLTAEDRGYKKAHKEIKKAQKREKQAQKEKEKALEREKEAKKREEQAQNKLKNTVLQMLKDKLSLEIISRYTGLSVEEVVVVKEEL